jgi:hypothetical protein
MGKPKPAKSFFEYKINLYQILKDNLIFSNFQTYETFLGSPHKAEGRFVME